jgi:regulator of extracellular matrix RemA (YlzA/DUF370 family)
MRMQLTVIPLVAVGGLVRAQRVTDPASASARAVEMLQKTKDGTVWSLLRQTHDNTTRSFVIRDLARLGVQPDVVIQRLRTESDVSGRRALLLALGAYSDDDISSAQREALERLVVEVSPWRAHFATAIPQEESCAR